MNNESFGSAPVRVIVIGAGNRARKYLEYAHRFPERLRPVAVAELNGQRRRSLAREFSLPAAACFARYEELFAAGIDADMVLVTTPDAVHYDPAVRAIRAGYHVLLEKPIAQRWDECLEIARLAREHGVLVGVCHVLRYHPYFTKIRQLVASGELGEIVSVNHTVCVGLDRMLHSYVRGVFRRAQEANPILLAKCCHDIDLTMWMMAETRPVTVCSFGSKFQFKPENAPKEAGTRCLVDCPLMNSCRYSAKRLYLDQPERWAFYIWDKLEGLEHPTEQDRVNLLKGDSNYGKCIYKCNNNVVDHQSVLVNFASGATGTHNMVGGSSKSERRIHIIGTLGEIYGDFEESKFYISKIHPTKTDEKTVEEVDLHVTGDMVGAYGGHGGGDERLAEDFVNFLQGGKTSLACTSIFDSVAGHLCVYLADRSREQNGMPQEVIL